ncbi:hypothetical protein LT493_11120 [Streptomyces tricolor]|nr:hypothetical protein [Streptomyces tricolor]
MTSHYGYLATLTAWRRAAGRTSSRGRGALRPRAVPGRRTPLGDDSRSLHQLAGDHETPNGINERIRTMVRLRQRRVPDRGPRRPPSPTSGGPADRRPGARA